MKCINIGCGCNPTENWINYENSASVRLAKMPILTRLMNSLGLLDERQRQAIAFFKEKSIQYADARKRIPEVDHSIDVLYSSHMLEHLDVTEAQAFLAEAKRVLKHNGYIRLAVPDIRLFIDDYLQTGDANKFMDETGLSRRSPQRLRKKILFLFIGDRGHKHMFDGTSLCKLLASAGFKDTKVMPEGETMIPNPGTLDLAERSPASVYVEAVNP